MQLFPGLVSYMQVCELRKGIECCTNILLQPIIVVIDCKRYRKHTFMHHGRLRMPGLRYVVKYEFNLGRQGRVGTNLIKEPARIIQSHAHLSRKWAAEVLKQLHNDRRRGIAQKPNSERTRWKRRGHDTHRCTK